MHYILKLSACALLVATLGLPAIAAGTKTDDTAATTPAAAPDPWEVKWGKLPALYVDAVAMAKAGKYPEAISALTALNKMEDPRVLNWIGFSTRKSGDAIKALTFYDKALSIAPDFTPAHEYRGEAYIQLKDMAKAKEELAMIAKLCGNMTCEEYKDLNEDLGKAGS